jgi:histone deacetylase 1/2
MHTKYQYSSFHGISLIDPMATAPAASDGLAAPVISDAGAGTTAPVAVPPGSEPLDAAAILALTQVPPAPAVAPPGISISFQMRGVQIRNIIPHSLDLSTGSYAQWRTLLELAVEEYGVLDHLTSDAAPAIPDVEWRTIDSILKRWIYGSISRELVGMIMDTSKTARQLYISLGNVFLNNRRHRAVHLTSDLHEQRQGSLGVAQYCARIKTIADALRDCEQPPTDDTLVTVLTRGLNERHHVTGKILLSNSGRITFDDARNMLLLDEMQGRATERVASQSALMALGRTAGGQGGGGGGGAPPPAPGYPRPPGSHGGIGTYGANYGVPSSPSPNQGKTKRKRVTTNGGYTANGAVTPTAPEQRPWTGYVQAWPAHYNAPRLPGLLGPRPQAYTAVAPASYGGPQYAAPPSVLQAPLYNAPPPQPPQQLLFPAPGQAFGQNPPPPYQPPPQQYQLPPYPDSAMQNQGSSNTFEQSALIGALTDLSLQGSSGQWIADSGASAHLSATQGTLACSRPVYNMAPVIVGNGSTLPVSHLGHTALRTSSRPLYLQNVLVAPDIVSNLLSVRRFTTDNQLSMEFDPFGVSVKDLHTQDLLLRCNSEGDLYPLFSPDSSSPTNAPVAYTTTTSDLWHRRLGHPGASSAFNKTRCNKISGLCRACQLGKHVRLPFSPSKSSTSAAFSLIHCDLWTAPFPSLSGFKYYLIIVDDFSHYMWTYPIRLKSDVHLLLVNFHAFVRTHFLTTIRTIQCDNGKEFDNSANRTFFSSFGTVLRFSCPYTSAQNGKAERAIRTTNDVLRTILLQASMPPDYWAEALHTATHLINIRPTKPLDLKTPHEALFSTPPSYDHLRVYGCLCYPNTAATIPHKLAPRSVPCVFIGYAPEHKGYRCLDRTTGRVYTSRHVTFDEGSFPFSVDLTPDHDDYSFDHDPETLPNPLDPLAALFPSPLPATAAPSPAAGCRAPAAARSPAAAAPVSPNSAATASAAPQTPSSHTSPAPLTPPPAPSKPLVRPVPLPTHPMRTRAQDGIFKPKRLFNLSALAPPSPIPTNYRSALNDPNWADAMRSEFTALVENSTWQLVPPPPGANVVSGKWVYKHKFHSDGSLSRYKARWVVRGFSQEHGIDYDETFSPVVKPSTIRIILSLAVSSRWPIHQLDVKNAFLHGYLSEVVYCQQPKGFEDPSHPHHVCLLRKSLYGLKQAPRAWFTRFANFITSVGFVSSKSDTSLFIFHSPTDVAYLLLYVDDIVLTASSDAFLHKIIAALSTEFSMTDLGPLSHFLGISVTRTASGLHLSQRQYALDLIDRAGMHDCNPVKTPIDSGSKLSLLDGDLLDNPTHYRSLTGALQYLTLTRPEISYAVQQACLFMHAPRTTHLNLVKRIIRYIKGTLDFGTHISPSSTSSLVAYSDADWAGCPDTRRSTSGFCVFLGDNLISWSSKRQLTVSRSSAEAEYHAVAHVVAESCWIRNLLQELHCPLHRSTVVYCDNVSAVYLSVNPVQHRRTKHIEIDIHFVRDKVQVGDVRVLHIPTASQYADIFTKGLPSAPFVEFRSSLTVQEPPVDTAGGC